MRKEKNSQKIDLVGDTDIIAIQGIRYQMTATRKTVAALAKDVRSVEKMDQLIENIMHLSADVKRVYEATTDYLLKYAGRKMYAYLLGNIGDMVLPANFAYDDSSLQIKADIVFNWEMRDFNVGKMKYDLSSGYMQISPTKKSIVKKIENISFAEEVG